MLLDVLAGPGGSLVWPSGLCPSRAVGGVLEEVPACGLVEELSCCSRWRETLSSRRGLGRNRAGCPTSLFGPSAATLTCLEFLRLGT